MWLLTDCIIVHDVVWYYFQQCLSIVMSLMVDYSTVDVNPTKLSSVLECSVVDVGLGVVVDVV